MRQDDFNLHDVRCGFVSWVCVSFCLAGNQSCFFFSDECLHSDCDVLIVLRRSHRPHFYQESCKIMQNQVFIAFNGCILTTWNASFDASCCLNKKKQNNSDCQVIELFECVVKVSMLRFCLHIEFHFEISGHCQNVDHNINKIMWLTPAIK